MTKDQIRAIFMANGFEIKEGNTDLKPYVYEAAEALLSASIADTAGAKPVAWLIDWPDEPELGHYFAEKPVDPMYGRSRPLTFAAPPAPSVADAAGASDAERYMWLKHFGGDYLHWQNLKRLESDEEFDAYVDAGIAKESGND